MHGISPTTPPSYPTFAYPRRVSPPGSPAPKKCCYDHAETYRNRESFLCCCYTCPKRSSTSVFATVAVCCMVLGYTILGAFVFMALEGGFRRDTSIAASKSSLKREGGVAGDLRSQTVERLWSITENLNILYRENWTRLAAEEVMEFQEALFRALRSGAGYVGPGDSTILYHQHQHRWSFSSSFLYSLTLITTIGYGSVSPRTSWGKLVTIIYALVGIPLMLVYLTTTGDVLARSFRRLYGKLCGSPQKPQCPCNTRVRVPVTLCLVMVLAYICSGALLFHRLENWSLLEGSYFCFTSLGTIGFGDLLPGQQTEEISLCACSAYILTGMALVAMCFSLVQDEVLGLLRLVGASCSRSDSFRDEENVPAVS